MNRVTTLSYFLSDHLGSTSALTDANGNLVEESSYDSFGNSTGSTRTRYGYTGRRDDAQRKSIHLQQHQQYFFVDNAGDPQSLHVRCCRSADEHFQLRDAD